MSDSYFTPEEQRYIVGSEVYSRFSTVKFSSLTVATLVTALNAVTPSPANAPLIKWLVFLIRNLAMDSSGQQKIVDKNSDSQLYYGKYDEIIANIRGFGGSPETNEYTWGRAYLNPTALVGGALAATDMTAGGNGIAGKTVLVHYIEAYLQVVAADKADNGNVVVQVTEETAGTVLAQTIVSAQCPFSFSRVPVLKSTTANKKIQVTAVAGLNPLTVSKISVNCFFRAW